MTTDYPASIVDAAQALREGSVTSVQLVQDTLTRIDEQNGALGAYLTVFTGSALAAAESSDRERAEGRDRGILHGIPLALKDNLASDDGPTTGQSDSLPESWGSQGDGTAVRRLRAAGSVIVGKTSTMELASGLHDPEKSYPQPKNPWDIERWPGGSSSGSGAAVAAGLALAALGTDTGGSIRCPAGFAGVTGFKPTFGVVPKDGCVPASLTYDVIGPLARSARDAAEVFSVLTDGGSHRLDLPADWSTASTDLSGMRIGIDRSVYDGYDVDDNLESTLDRTAETLRSLGATVIDATIPMWGDLNAASLFGPRVEAASVHLPRLREQWNDFGRDLRVGVATSLLVSGAEYAQAQRIRAVGRQRMREFFTATCDAVITPTAAVEAPLLEGMDLTPFRTLTMVWSQVGVPAISIPMGSGELGLPLSIQIASGAYEDARVLRIAHAFQSATAFHLTHPAVLNARVDLRY